ncbi:MAG: glucosamine-6-phosphate deaminase [Lentisphaeria bacterium]|nr:glucosamine-6-phosphate deaminase [Lentisphaeria bacterium]
MNLVICKDKLTCGAEAAKFGAEKIRQAIAAQGECRIILATGASQFEMLSALLNEEGIDWSKVTMFHLDEYVGLPVTHPASFRKYLTERFVEKLPVKMKEVNLVEGDAADLKASISALGKKIAEKPIDVCFIGIGENGHIAFNDPPADFDTEEPYLIVNLDDVCRNQQLGEGWFPNFEAVPKQAVSMSVRQIMKSRCIVNTVPDARKAHAIKITFEEELSPMHPASVIRLHPDCRTFCDIPAAAELSSFTKDICTLK